MKNSKQATVVSDDKNTTGRTVPAAPQGANASSADTCKCGSKLKSGLKYKDVCTTCNPQYATRCGGCQRLLWDCMCIKPHTWE